MDSLDAWRQRATQVTSRLRGAGRLASERVTNSVAGGLSATATVASEAYTAALDWKNNSEFSNWLTNHLSNQHATLTSKAMDAEYLRTHVGGGWHSSTMAATVLPVVGRPLARRCPTLARWTNLASGRMNIGKT
jgi:hypothetical protein